MRTLADFLRTTPDLEPADTEWLHLLVEDWHLLADLAFSDLVLWVAHEGGWVAAAHTRPMTGPMVFVEEVVGQEASVIFGDLVTRAADAGQSEHVRERGQDQIHERARPVRRAGRTIGIISIHDLLDSGRPHTRLEEAYGEMGDELFTMVAEGGWPTPTSPSGARRGAPRVGDGVMRLTRSGAIEYASPNALSAIRQLGHLGPIEGEVLVQLLSGLPGQSGHVDEGLALVAMGRAAWRSDVTANGAALAVRAVPLVRGRDRHGAIVLVRDVSELRRRGTELMTKDQSIREIHHRVKNNLQTVSALLRLQARRASSSEARSAIEEAMRRVSVIAVVHDSLSQSLDESIDFDDILDKGLRLAPDLSSPLVQVTTRRVGSFGKIATEDASALLLAITELVTNAVEHGFPFDVDDPDQEPVHGLIEVRPERDGDFLRLRVVDDGVGLSDERGPGDGLGTQIVRTLITADLRGSIAWHPREGGGTQVLLEVPLRTAE